MHPLQLTAVVTVRRIAEQHKAGTLEQEAGLAVTQVARLMKPWKHAKFAAAPFGNPNRSRSARLGSARLAHRVWNPSPFAVGRFDHGFFPQVGMPKLPVSSNQLNL